MLAHPFDDGTCATVYRSIWRTARGFGSDGAAYQRLLQGVVDAWPRIASDILGPPRVPRHPLDVLRFGLQALRSAEGLTGRVFADRRTRALFAGICAHGMLPLDRLPTAAIGLVLGAMAHLTGWVLPRGGAQRLTDALAAHLRSLGGEIVAGMRVQSIDDLPPAAAVLCDLSPRPFLRLAGHRLPTAYRRTLEAYRYGMGVYKVDWALDGPIPWRADGCAVAATVHLGGTIEEIAQAERDAWEGRIADRPFVLLVQPTLFDASRAPAGRHTAWTYCHVPHGSSVDMLSRIERQIERFAPGFCDRVVARAVMTPADLERHNANFVGGDIGAGVMDIRQMFRRPTWSAYSTPVRGLYLCSASTPPGVGVHGLCGYYAARRALDDVLRD